MLYFLTAEAVVSTYALCWHLHECEDQGMVTCPIRKETILGYVKNIQEEEQVRLVAVN